MPGADFYLDWGGDLLLTPSGSIQLAVGWTQTRQRIIRRIISVPAQQLPDGSYTIATNMFDQAFGIGLGADVDKSINQDYESMIERKIAQGVLEDEDVNTSIPPSIVFQRPTPSSLWIIIGVTLISGQPGTISIKIGPQPAPADNTGKLDYSNPANSQFLPGLA